VVSKLNNDLNEVHTIRIVVKIYFIAIVHCLALFVTPAYAESLLPVNTKEVEPSVNVFTNKLEPREIVTEWFDMDSIRSDFGLTFLRSKITYSYVNDSEPKSVIYKEWAIKCDEKSFAQVTHRIKSSGSNISVAWPREKLAFKSPSGDDQRFLVDTACNFENTSEALKSKELARVIQEAIDRNPTIKKWQDEGGANWTQALACDDELKKDAAYTSSFYDERFARVVSSVESGATCNGKSEWMFVSKQKNMEAYLHSNSISTEGDLTYFWTKYVFNNASGKDSSGRVIQETKSKWVVDCQRHVGAISSIVDIGSGDAVLNNIQIKTLQFKDIPPGGLSDKILNTACLVLKPAVKKAPLPATPPIQNSTPHVVSTGSGIIVTYDGFVLTNHHVINGCSSLKLRDAARKFHDATLVSSDERSDLALLKIRDDSNFTAATFRSTSKPIETGESVGVLGFPLAGLLASDVNVSFGYVGATAGLADDTSKLQISAPVQPGNSGGPLLDMYGDVVGVVVQKLDAIKMAKATGDIPQNINFAVKGEIAQLFLGANRVNFKSAASIKKLSNTSIASKGREFTVLVECYK